MPTVDVTDTKEVDPIAKAKMLEAQKLLKAESNSLKWQLDDLINPKKQGSTFNDMMKNYAKPSWMILLGIFATMIFAVISPMYGWFIMEAMNGLNAGYVDRLRAQNGLPVLSEDTVFERALPWCIVMIIGSVGLFITKGIGYTFLSKISENITY